MDCYVLVMNFKVTYTFYFSTLVYCPRLTCIHIRREGDKYSTVVVMNKVDYVENVNSIINESIRQGKYKMNTNTTHEDLEKFQSFLYCNFKSHPRYNKQGPVSDQPARFFATAKTPPQNDKLTLRPRIDQSNA